MRRLDAVARTSVLMGFAALDAMLLMMLLVPAR